MTFFNNKQRGAVLVEVLVAVSIMSIVFIELSGAAARTLAFSYQSLKTAQASFLLEEGAEAVKTIRDADWNILSSASLETPYHLSWGGSAWSLAGSGDPVEGFTRTVVLHSVYRDATDDIVSMGGTLDPKILRVTISVAWQSGSSVNTKSFSIYVADIFN